MGGEPVTLAGREYPFPETPVVVVCVDGSEPEYHERAIAAGRMPYLERLAGSEAGSVGTATSAMPSFTNPNNISIATGAPPAVHGICGNYFYDAERGEEVMMNSPELLRSPTLFAAFSRVGARVAVVTAKDKLRRLLGAGLRDGVCFSAEHASRASLDENGVERVLDLVGLPQPEVYSADLSEFVLAAGVRLMERDRPDLVYLSLTDYIQHKHAPGSPVANDFYAMLDGYLQELDALGVVLVVTGDHGMNRKSDAEGRPNVVYAQRLLDEALGEGRSRVVLPITDPYTAHHGALGSFATIHLPEPGDVAAARSVLASTPGVAEVLGRAEAAAAFELPPDRIGELVALAERDTVIGTAEDRHDLSQLREPLRSHGGRTEQRVPLILNRPLTRLPPTHEPRNYDAYWLALNHVARSPA